MRFTFWDVRAETCPCDVVAILLQVHQGRKRMEGMGSLDALKQVELG